MNTCEVCGPTTKRVIICGSIDEPMIFFCADHYIGHVEGAHQGHPLAGCMSLAEATKVQDEKGQ